MQPDTNEKALLHWKPSRNLLLWTVVIAVLLVMLIFFIVFGYVYRWEWMGVGETYRPKPPGQDIRRMKTLWDWLQLLIVPVAVAVGTFVLNRAAQKRDDKAQDEQKAREEAIQEQRAQDAALEAYLKQMTQLLLREQLATSGKDSVVATVARAQTLTTLSRLGPNRKKSILQFLHESKLINRDNPVIGLEGADLRRANLSHVKLPGVNLSGADLKWANLHAVYMPETDLSGADLQWSSLSGFLPRADLNNAHMLGATIGATDLTAANLKWAGLFGTDLGRAKHLTDSQIGAAMGDRDTILPFYLKHPQGWKHRMGSAAEWQYDEEMDVVVHKPRFESERMKERGATRISLSPGRTTAVHEGAVVRGDRDGYLVNANAGQQLTVRISSLADNAVFQIYEPDDEQDLPGAGTRDDATVWRGEVPRSGDYTIIVGGTRGNAEYKIEVSVT